MSDALKTQLTQLLTALMTNVQNAAGWAGGQLPLLIQEKIFVDRIFLTFVVLLCVVVLVGCAKLLLYSLVEIEKVCYHDEGKYIATIIASTGLGLALLVVVCTFAYDLCLVWFAPRLYILNWLRGMI